ncbi:MAG: potassium channel family protein [Planctomycetota bacterium]
MICVLATPTAATDPLTWPVYLAAAITVGLCVVLHYETIRLLIWAMKKYRPSPRLCLIGSVLTLLTAHVIQIIGFAITMGVLTLMFGPRVGQLVGEEAGTLTDAFYFSTAVFTTVGFGDIVPVGPLRALVAIEALTGLVLITWSASFSFLVMQRFFLRPGDPEADPPPPSAA